MKTLTDFFKDFTKAELAKGLWEEKEVDVDGWNGTPPHKLMMRVPTKAHEIFLKEQGSFWIKTGETVLKFIPLNEIESLEFYDGVHLLLLKSGKTVEINDLRVDGHILKFYFLALSEMMKNRNGIPYLPNPYLQPNRSPIHTYGEQDNSRNVGVCHPRGTPGSGLGDL